MRFSEQDKPVLYERLPELCFNSRLVSHTLRECPDLINVAALELSTPKFKYGPWMLATIRSERGKHQKQGSEEGSKSIMMIYEGKIYHFLPDLWR